MARRIRVQAGVWTGAMVLMAVVLASPSSWGDPPDCSSTAWPACSTEPIVRLRGFPLVSERLIEIPADPTPGVVGDQTFPVAVVLVDAAQTCQLDVVTLVSQHFGGALGPTLARLIVSDNLCDADFGTLPGSTHYLDINGSISVNGRSDTVVEMVAGDWDTNGFPDLAVLVNHAEPGQSRQAEVIVVHNNNGATADRFDMPDPAHDFYPLGIGDLGTNGVGLIPEAFDIAAADLDKDGDMDLIVVAASTQTEVVDCDTNGTLDEGRIHSWAYILWNGGDANTQPLGRFEVTEYLIRQEECNKENPVQVACGELNNDGHGEDVAIGFNAIHPDVSAVLRVYKNSGQSGGGSGSGHADGERFSFGATDRAVHGGPTGDAPAPSDLVVAPINGAPGGGPFWDVAGSVPVFGWGEVFLNPQDAGGATGPDDLIPDSPAVTDAGQNPYAGTAGGFRPGDLAWADLGRRGQVSGLRDLVMVTDSAGGAGGLSVMVNQGAGLFPEVADTCLSAVAGKDVALGDVNGDGCVDAVSVGRGQALFPHDTNNVKNFISIFYGDCTGKLRQQQVYGDETSLFNPCVDVDCGDLNGDGLPDVIVTQFSAQIDSNDRDLTLLVQNPDHTFAEGARLLLPTPPMDMVTGAVKSAVADFDAQNHDDIATVFANVSASGNPTLVRIWTNDGAMGFTHTTAAVTDGTDTGNDLSDIAAGDIDGDGAPDLVMTDHVTQGRIWTVLNDGTGQFDFSDARQWALPGATQTLALNPKALVVFDANGDGSLDVAVANQDSDTMGVLLNQGGGDFSLVTADREYTVGTAAGADPRSIAAGRLNDDALPDLATANFADRSVTVLLNNQTPGSEGTFDASTNVAVGFNPIGITLCDVDSDCLDDLVVICQFGGTSLAAGSVICVKLNNSPLPGHFDGPLILLPGGLVPTAITSRDLDHIAGPDILTVGTKSPAHFSLLRITHTLALLLRGDFNGDGLVDGDDIQRFIDVFYDPSHASRKGFYACDMNGDGAITIEDLLCFIDALLFDTRCDSSVLCAVSSPSAQQSGQVGAPEPGGQDGGAGPGGQSPLDLLSDSRPIVAQWDAAHPRSDYPELTDLEYKFMRRGSAGQLVFNAIGVYCQWHTCNRRIDHAELSDPAYEDLCRSQKAALGLVAAGSSGGTP